MGAKADIDGAIDAAAEPAGCTLRLGASAVRAFVADLFHDGHITDPPPDDRERFFEFLPATYRGVRVVPLATDAPGYFDGWDLTR